jgi:sodium-dependent dicarboxylate transporter 2/3/5
MPRNKGQIRRSGLPPMPKDIYLAVVARRIDWKRLFYVLLGIFLFSVIYLWPELPDAVDPQSKHFPLTHQGKAALALFCLTAVWWVFEVMPIGVTSIAVGVIQALFLIRMAFSQTGLTKRMAYRMLTLVGERTSTIYLGVFIMTAGMTLIMAHTAVAAAVFPLLQAIYPLYQEDQKPTRFGKGMFIGMAFTAGAGSIVTLLGAARGAVAIGFFKDIAGREISFFQLTYYMFPLGWLMVFALWGLLIFFFRPERSHIPGLRERAKALHAKLGRMTRKEVLTLVIVFGTIAVLSVRSFIPLFKPLDKSAIILVTTVLFFLFKILTINDLELIPWNIILLFGGAMSIGFCLWQTGAAQWLAINWLTLFQKSSWFFFVMGVAFFVLVMTNFIMNVAAIAICLPVALVMAPYLGVAPEVVFFSCLATAGMPFVLLVGAAPNAIAYESRQFSSGEFFLAGIPASLLLMIVLAAFILVIWPLMGMPVLVR